MIACLSNSHKLRDKYNLIRRKRERQVVIEHDFQPSSRVTQDIISFVNNLPPKKRSIFNEFIYLFARFGKVYVTQSNVAFSVGCSRKHVNEFLGELENLGIMKIGYRHLTSCIYHLSSYFKNADICFSLSKILGGFWSLALVLSSSPAFQKKPAIPNNFHEVTQLYLNTICKNREQGNKEKLPVAGHVQCNNFLTQAQEKVPRSKIRFKKGEQIIWGLEEQAEFYASLGYERFE